MAAASAIALCVASSSIRIGWEWRLLDHQKLHSKLGASAAQLFHQNTHALTGSSPCRLEISGAARHHTVAVLCLDRRVPRSLLGHQLAHPLHLHQHPCTSHMHEQWRSNRTHACRCSRQTNPALQGLACVHATVANGVPARARHSPAQTKG